MTLKKRLHSGALSLFAVAALAAGSATAAPRPLSQADAQHYAAAFDSSERGDFIDAQMQAVEIHDKALLGYLSFKELMHPSAHRASFDELAGWLGKFRELPLADRIFALAAKRNPAEAQALPTPQTANAPIMAPVATGTAPVSDRGRQAREAFYAGDARRALAIAPAAGERWIAGLAAYRLKDFVQAQAYFEQVARDGGQDPWLRAAGAYWAARSAGLQGETAKVGELLRMAAQAPQTFYGMIAARQVQLQTAATASQDRLTLAAYAPPDAEVERLVQSDPRAHRAAALAQIGRADDANQELRAGLSLARSDTERARWTRLILALNGTAEATAWRRGPDPADYPTPPLAPRSGFTIEKALVYAIVRQESRFNPLAVSPVGAVGLMQLMPEAAARAAGDDKLKADMSPLFDPAMNLRVGQDYLTWLMERGVGYDILRTVAAYNGGPGVLQRTSQMLGGDADSLMIIECLPSLETRNYVEKVMAAYWTYRRMFGEEARTLDALAAGAAFVDARLDLADPGGARPQLTSQALQIGMR
jgi:soluble lytic murein transglycosylase-like protein